LIGGSISALGGGRFGSGFLGAFASGLLSPQIEGLLGPAGTGGTMGKVLRTVASAIVGGISSKLGGGKFLNGAAMAAFARLFNDERHWRASAEVSIRNLLKGEIDSDGIIDGSISTKKIFKFELDTDGTVTVSQIGRQSYSFDGSGKLVGAGLELGSTMEVTAIIDPSGALQFKGALKIPSRFNFMGMSFGLSLFSPKIPIRSAILDNTGLLGNAARALSYRSRQIENAENCAEQGGC
jgi:hypothetical protein